MFNLNKRYRITHINEDGMTETTPVEVIEWDSVSGLLKVDFFGKEMIINTHSKAFLKAFPIDE